MNYIVLNGLMLYLNKYWWPSGVSFLPLEVLEINFNDKRDDSIWFTITSLDSFKILIIASNDVPFVPKTSLIIFFIQY